MDRDSSVTVLVTRSMLTSLNDSTMVSVPERREDEEAVLILSHFSRSRCWEAPDAFRTSPRILRRDARVTSTYHGWRRSSPQRFLLYRDNGAALSIRTEHFRRWHSRGYYWKIPCRVERNVLCDIKYFVRSGSQHCRNIALREIISLIAFAWLSLRRKRTEVTCKRIMFLITE